ncbi:MAG: albusnodin/ikarugamycin family macrolactam cyclase [Actinomycetota bacterium]|nr:albusnodin/ikarugamycin family macrolactam cyclase [Actinomycetota bacterium]
MLAHGAQPQVRAAWRPEPAVADLNEGADRLRTALTAAVAVRIDDSHQPSSDCSGGLDSTSLTLLAATHLDGPATLHAVTIHPAGTGCGGDLDYAAAAVAEQPRIRHQPCPLDARHLPYSRMTELMPATDEPAPTTVAIARVVAEFDLLRRLGSDCHLTGDGGDTLLGGHPAYLADLALSGRAGRLCRHAIGWARLRRGSWSPTHRRAWPAWSTTSARELARKVIASAQDTAPIPGSVGATALMEAIQAVGRTARSDAQVAEHYGVTVHNPFVDPQVIAAALSVPAWLRASPFRYKPLLAWNVGGRSGRRAEPAHPRQHRHQPAARLQVGCLPAHHAAHAEETSPGRNRMTSTTSTQPEELRDRMVEYIRQAGHLHSSRVEQALRTVPRHLFVPAYATGRSRRL